MNIKEIITLKVIIKNGLSIRQIPPEIYSLHNINEYRPGDDIIESPEDGIYIGNSSVEIGFGAINSFGTKSIIKRKTIPKNAGYWMCKKIEDISNPNIIWNENTDNLAPTLEESVNLFLQKKEGRLNIAGNIP